MAAERIVVDTFDVNGIDDEDPVFKQIRKYRRDTYGAPDSKLMWGTVPNKGALVTLIDAYPQDGNVEIDFTRQPNGMRLHVIAITFGYVAPSRPTDAPTVEAYAKELVSIIKQVLHWAPVPPHKDAPRSDWYEYRYQVEVILDRKLDWDDMLLAMGANKDTDYDSMRQGYSRHKQKRDAEKLSQDVTGL